jgi:threonine/homoserine/homoserine lactone efflux protein
VVVRNAVSGGRRRGLASTAGVICSSAIQGTAVALGLGAVIVASEPLFVTIKWAGVAYLLFLAVQALRSAMRATDVHAPLAGTAGGGRAVIRGLRQGFISNITNPKVLAFYLAVLPQFLAAGGQSPWQAVPLALTHAAISALYLALVVVAVHRARWVLSRQRVRRWMDGLTGAAMLGFGVRLAAEGP